MKKTHRLILLRAFWSLLLLALLSFPLPASEKPKSKPLALLAGTVFTAEGFSLPGVRLSIKRKSDRKPKWHAVSDRRGEFAVRLPPGPETYEVRAESPGHENQTKTVEFQGAERVDVLFRLAPKEGKAGED